MALVRTSPTKYFHKTTNYIRYTGLLQHQSQTLQTYHLTRKHMALLCHSPTQYVYVTINGSRTAVLLTDFTYLYNYSQ
jgi:hypothetical protein